MARTLAVLLAIVALAAAAALWWWTAPASAPSAELAAALGEVAARGDGAVVVAQPTRAGRWLFRHREAAALLATAAPDALRTGQRLATPARALAQAADGPLRVWWRGSELALAAPVDAGARQGLTEMAALLGLAAADVDGVFAVASDPALLADRGMAEAPLPILPHAPDHATAVAWCGHRVWWVTARGSRLQAVTGAPIDPPAAAAPSLAATSGAGPLLAAAGLGRLGLGDRVVLVLSEGDGWGVRLGGARLSSDFRRLLGARDGAADRAHYTRGPFGEVWWRADDGVAVATDEQLLAALDAVEPGEHGLLRGTQLARAFRRLAGMLEPLPGFAARSRALRAAADIVENLGVVRWRIATDGGIIVMEW